MGLGDSARALYGIKERQPQADEMSSQELRAEGQRRAAHPKPPPKSRLARLWGWFNS